MTVSPRVRSLRHSFSSNTATSVLLDRLTTVTILKEAFEGPDEVVDADEVAVLVVALDPRDTVLQGVALAQGTRLAKVYHPDARLRRRVMHKEQGTANDLQQQYRVYQRHHM